MTRADCSPSDPLRNATTTLGKVRPHIGCGHQSIFIIEGLRTAALKAHLPALLTPDFLVLLSASRPPENYSVDSAIIDLTGLGLRARNTLARSRGRARQYQSDFREGRQ
jgi:hypothetical protein